MFFKKKNKISFYSLLTEQARTTRDGVAALCEFCRNPTEENGDYVKTIEQEADNIRRKLIEEINSTFITPIDREDLFRLSGCIDDLVDYAWTTVNEVRIYDVLPDANLLALSEVLLEMAEGLLVAVSNLEKNKQETTNEACKVKKLENKMDILYHESIAELFESDDFKKILRYREIYRHLNNASDKGDVAADILNNITVKL